MWGLASLITVLKVLDSSFNNFKGPGFEPFENCKALQQLYLAGNQITSLVSLPELPVLDHLYFLSMASQPRLQGFPKMGLLTLFVASSMLVLKVLLVTAVGSFLALYYVNIMTEDARKHITL